MCQVFEFFERRRRVSPFLGNPESGQEASRGEEEVGEKSKGEGEEDNWAVSSKGSGDEANVAGGLTGRNECRKTIGQERQLASMFKEAILEGARLVWMGLISSSSFSSRVCKEGHIRLKWEKEA